MLDSPIFIVGTERSGSNLLRLILNSHSQIAGPHPPHIVHYFAPLEARYGDLSQDEPFRELAEDIGVLLKCHIHPWDVPVDLEEAIRCAPSRTAFGLSVALYEQYRIAKQKKRWVCKSTFMIDHVDTVLALFPRARIIFLVRDPRDVAVSSSASVFSPYHPYSVARLWARQQCVGLDLMDRLSPQTLLLLRYEELVSKPEETVRRLCEFLGESFEPQMLQYFTTEDARRSASLAESWKNTARPITSDKVGRYREQLSVAERRLIEQVAGGAMARLGYSAEVSAQKDFRPSAVETARYWLLEQYLRSKVEIRALRHDRNVWRRIARGLFLEFLHVWR